MNRKQLRITKQFVDKYCASVTKHRGQREARQSIVRGYVQCPVPALLLTHLTVPSQFLESLGFDPIGNSLGRQEVIFGHLVLSSVW